MKKFKEKFIVDVDYIREKERINLLIGNGFSTAMMADFDYFAVTKAICEYIEKDVDNLNMDILTTYFTKVKGIKYWNIEEFIYELMKVKACFDLCERDDDEVSKLNELYINIMKEFSTELIKTKFTNGNNIINENIMKVYTTNYLFEFQNYCEMEDSTNYISYLIDGTEYATGYDRENWEYKDFINFNDKDWDNYVKHYRGEFETDQTKKHLYNQDFTNTIIYHIHGGFTTSEKNVYGSINEWKDTQDFPYIILDGTAESKMQKIEHNKYTKLCFKNFTEQNGVLVVLGNSLSESDKHLVSSIENSLKNQNLSELIIGIYCDENDGDADFIYNIHNEIVKFDKSIRDKIKFIKITDKDRTIEKITFKD